MKSLRIETNNYGWINRFTLRKDKKDGFILKVIQYQKKQEGYKEVHIWGNNSVEKLSQFLSKEIRR